MLKYLSIYLQYPSIYLSAKRRPSIYLFIIKSIIQSLLTEHSIHHVILYDDDDDDDDSGDDDDDADDDV